jgi:protease-4
MAKKNDHSVLLFLLVFLGMVLIASLSLIMVSGFGGTRVAIIPLKGDIVTETSDGLFGSEETDAYTFISFLESADSDPSIAAIVIEINSGGGSPLASSEMEKAIKNVSKPVVAWIGEVGASGGYYVASAADVIIAHPYSLTGSIGAVSYNLQLSGLYEKYGLNMTVIKSGQFKDMGSQYRNMTEEEAKMFQDIVDYLYMDFKNLVLKNREGKVDPVKIDEIADGRIFLGNDAYNYGLVDELGGRRDAIMKAGELGGIVGYPETVVFEKNEETAPWSLLGMSIGNAIIESIQKMQAGSRAAPQLQ